MTEENRLTAGVAVKKLREGAMLPVYATPYAAGADLFALLPEPVQIRPGETVKIPTGLAMEIPAGYAGLIYARSGLGVKQDLAPANKVGVVDSDYRGELLIFLHNHGKEVRTVENGARIAQLVITPYLTARFTETEALSGTDRGESGFGSTGK